MGGWRKVPGAATARNHITVMFGAGDVAVAYRDGWWDHRHHFHHWRRDERRWYQTHYRRDYRDWDHDRDSRYHRDGDRDDRY